MAEKGKVNFGRENGTFRGQNDVGTFTKYGTGLKRRIEGKKYYIRPRTINDMIVLRVVRLSMVTNCARFPRAAVSAEGKRCQYGKAYYACIGVFPYGVQSYGVRGD